MMHGIAAITVEEVAEKLADGEDFILLDVREPHELDRANLGDAAVNVPLTEIAMNQFDAFPPELRDHKDAEIVVMCHHGNRSAQVTAWLRGNGYTNVWNMTGGIDAYARQVDASVGRY